MKLISLEEAEARGFRPVTRRLSVIGDVAIIGSVESTLGNLGSDATWVDHGNGKIEAWRK